MAVVTKPDVRFGGFTFALLTILDTVVWCDAHPVPGQPKDLMITSASDGTHMKTSRHYTYEALDLRCKDMVPSVKQAFISNLKVELGEAFTVLLEDEGKANEHLHLQPKKKGT
jgi:hypothetical protein